MDNFEKNLNKQIIDSFSFSSVPDLKNEILKSNKLKRKKDNKTKITLGILIPSLSFTFAMIVLLPILKNDNTADGPVIVTEVNNKNNQIAFSILSAENMIDQYQGSSFGLKMKNYEPPYPPTQTELSEDVFISEMKNINPYMFTAECMIDTTISSSYSIVYDEESEYQYVMTIKETSDESIKFYYNETLKHHEDDEYILEGYFDYNGTKFNVHGEKEVDTDNDEEDDKNYENHRSEYPEDPYHEDESEYELNIEIDLNNGYLLCVYHEIETSDNKNKEIYNFAYVNKNANHGRDELQEFVSIKFIDGKKHNSNVEIERFSKNNPVSVYTLDYSTNEQYKYLLTYGIFEQNEYNHNSEYFGTIDLGIKEKEDKSYYLYHETNKGYEIELIRN